MSAQAIASIEALFLSLLSLLGLLAGTALKPRLDYLFLLGVSYAIGLAICLLVSVLLIMLPVPFTGSILFAVLILLGVALGFYNYRFGGITRRYLGVTLLYFVSFAGVAWLFGYYNFMVTSNDSLMMMRLGEILAYTGHLDPTMTLLGSRPISIPVFQGIANFLGIGIFTALFPLLMVPMLCGFLRGGWLTLTSFSVNKNAVLVFLFTGAVFLASGAFVQWNAFYINSHLASSLYLLLFFIVVVLSFIKKEATWLYLSSFFMAAFCLWRLEDIGLAAVFIYLLIPAVPVSDKDKLLASLAFSVPVITWLIYLYILYAPTGMFLNEKILLMIALMVAVIFMIILSRHYKIFGNILRFSPHLVLSAATLVLLLAVIAEPEHMAESVDSILSNSLLGWGKWGTEWMVILPLLVLSQGLPRPIPLDSRLLASIIFFGIFLVGISYFRYPYRLNMYDSGNRIMLHIFPICVYYVILKFGLSTGNGLMSQSPNNTPVEEPSGFADEAYHSDTLLQ